LLRNCHILLAAVTSFAATNGAEPVNPNRHYSLKLNSLISPQSQVQGLYLKARIDGGPPLRLLLDSGAKYIVLDKRRAASLGRRTGLTLDLVGFGPSLKTATQIEAGAVEIGDLTLRGCEIVTIEGRILDGVDGVVPLSLFARFLLRLDVPGRTLELDPYPPDALVQDGSYSVARADNNMLFLEAGLENSKPENSKPGYMLLDTGASFNAVSAAAAGRWKDYRVLYPVVPLLGGTGATEGFRLPPGVRFHFGAQVVSADPAVVVDLSNLSNHHGFPIAGVLGYPALLRSVVTIDYRDALVRFAAR
jgi:predicted aspartyl protease